APSSSEYQTGRPTGDEAPLQPSAADIVRSMLHLMIAQSEGRSRTCTQISQLLLGMAASEEQRVADVQMLEAQLMPLLDLSDAARSQAPLHVSLRASGDMGARVSQEIPPRSSLNMSFVVDFKAELGLADKMTQSIRQSRGVSHQQGGHNIRASIAQFIVRTYDNIQEIRMRAVWAKINRAELRHQPYWLKEFRMEDFALDTVDGLGLSPTPPKCEPRVLNMVYAANHTGPGCNAPYFIVRVAAYIERDSLVPIKCLADALPILAQRMKDVKALMKVVKKGDALTQLEEMAETLKAKKVEISQRL
ncbi:hypothetical protein KIPB_012129, partial [Kipferlia bialata]